LAVSSKLYDLRGLTPNAVISVRAEASGWLSAGFVFWLFFVPIMTLIGFGVAASICSRPTIPIETRRALYPRIALGSCFGSIGLHSLSFVALIATGSLSKIIDLWFGSSSALSVAPFLMLGPFTIVPLISLTRGIERRLFGPDPANKVDVPKPSPEEVNYRKRKLSLALGVAVVSALYIASNMVYLNVLTFDAIQHADKDRVAAAAASSMFGPVAVRIMAAAIMVSTFGCINGLTLSGARVYYAMAKDKLFFRQAETLDAKTHAPVFSLTVQCIWACLLTLSGRYNDLLDYVIFAVLLFYILTIVGLFVLRRTRPEMERPYKAFGYPALPAIYIWRRA